MQNYRNLSVWTKSHELGLRIYRVTQGFPRNEQYGLIAQMRRAALSIPSNIAEGCGRNGNPELAHFLDIAKGSANELDYQLLVAKDLTYLKPEDYQALAECLEEIQKMLASLIKRVRMKRPVHSEL